MFCCLTVLKPLALTVMVYTPGGNCAKRYAPAESVWPWPIIAAPPVEGQANEELIRLLAELFDAPRRRIAILSGQTSKNKVVGVSGISIDEAERVLAEALNQYREWY